MSDKEVIEHLYEDYRRGGMTLEQFLDRVARLDPDAVPEGFGALCAKAWQRGASSGNAAEGEK